MKSQLLQQLILTGMLSLSMVACQQSDSSKASPATTATPAPSKTATETKPKTTLDMKNESEAQLMTVGLKFAEQPELESTDLYLIQAKWDLAYYREFLKKAGIKPALEVQVQLLKNFCDAVDLYLEQELAIDAQDLENESIDDLTKLAERAKYEARLDLAQERLITLEKRLADRQKKAAAAANTKATDTTETKESDKTENK